MSNAKEKLSELLGYYLPPIDRIRSMSDEELGLFLAEWAEKPWAWKRDGEGECLAWLKDPYKEANHEHI